MQKILRKKLEINILTQNFKKNNKKKDWRKNLQHIKVRKEKVRKWSTYTTYRATCMRKRVDRGERSPRSTAKPVSGTPSIFEKNVILYRDTVSKT